MINKLGLPLFILGIILISFSFIRTQGIDVKTTKDVQGTVAPSSILLNPTSEPQITNQKFLVTKVIDGDTVDLQFNSKKETVRLIGIDAPESGNCFGNESAEKARELLSSKFIVFETDPSQGERDRYGRLLGYIFLENGGNFSDFMIRNGFAKEYTYNKPYKYQSVFKSAQVEAQSKKLGVWADGACSALQQTTVQQSINQPSESVQPRIQGSYTCDCSKLCSKISTCDEAYFQLNQCGCTKRDSDKDGVPCESLCK